MDDIEVEVYSEAWGMSILSVRIQPGNKVRVRDRCLVRCTGKIWLWEGLGSGSDVWMRK